MESRIYNSSQILYLFRMWGIRSPLPKEDSPLFAITPHGGKIRISNVATGKGERAYLVEPA